MNILLVGVNGYLGSELAISLNALSHKVFRGVSKARNPGEIEIPLYGMVDLSQSDFPDLVIDVSNRYIPNENPDSLRKMENSIIGVASTLCNSNEKWKVDILQGTSYLQYCSPDKQPWNHYADIRNTALKMLQDSAINSKSNLFEFVLHDTYGEVRREKFLDLCIKAVSGPKVKAGDGNSVINLTHVRDISNFISQKVHKAGLSESNYKRWSIRSDETYNLRELVNLIEEISGVSGIAEWGSSTQTRRQVVQLWNIPESNPEFKNTVKLQSWLQKLFSTDLRQ
jgi:nucleoside-diphosphate-sugar epimerase